MIIQSNGKDYEVVIGVEVHAQLKTNSKLFSSSKNGFTDSQNSNVNYFDLGFPGMLPVLNKEASMLAAKVGFAIHGSVQNCSAFDRKHYLYPDLPQGYQITQFYKPIVLGGYLDVYVDGKFKKIQIDRMHIEQDAGKLIHDRSDNESFVDYNRAGSPLVELVSAPDIRSPEEAMEFLKEFRAILRYTGASDADMEKGSFRCDANVSVRELGAKELGTRCEIKNLNSFRFVGKAIEYEANRQVDLIENGEKIAQQTRLFNVDTGQTFAMRDKETSADYRYFPDPDLIDVLFTDEELESIKQSMPQMHYDRRAAYISDYGLLINEANDLIAEKEYCDLFDFLIEKHEAKFALGWIMTELVGLLKKKNIRISELEMTKEEFRGLLDKISDDVISGKIAKDVLPLMIETKKSAEQIIEENNWKQVSDVSQLESIILGLIQDNPKEVDKYKNGNERMLGFFVGQVMKATKGQGNPGKINEILKKHLS